MIGLMEKDCVVFAYSPKYEFNGRSSLYLTEKEWFDPDNLLVWKIKGVKNAIMISRGKMRECDIAKEYDVLKGGEITWKRLNKDTLPRLLDAVEKYGFPSEEDRCENYYMIGHGKNLFEMGQQGVYQREFSIGYGVEDGHVKAIAELYKDLPTDDKLRKIAEHIEHMEGIPMFPLVVMDTKTCKVRRLDRQ